MQLKERFLNAVISGELGRTDDYGVIVESKEFKEYFNEINAQYVSSFLPAATIEIGQYNITHTKYVFRVKKGVYRVHPDAIEEQINKNKESFNRVKEPESLYLSNIVIKNALTIKSNGGYMPPPQRYCQTRRYRVSHSQFLYTYSNH